MGRLSRRPAADARRPRWRSRRRGTPPSRTCRSRRPSSPGVRAGAVPAAAYPRTPPGPAPGTAARWMPGRSPRRPPGGRRRPGGPPPASPPPALQAVVFGDGLEGVIGGREGDETVRVLGSAAHVEVGDRRAVLRQLLEWALVQQVVDVDQAAHPVALHHVGYAAGDVQGGVGGPFDDRPVVEVGRRLLPLLDAAAAGAPGHLVPG